MIDDNHPCYLLKYLRNKPVRELKGEEFLKLCQAENDRLLEIKITIDLDMGSDKRCVWVCGWVGVRVCVCGVCACSLVICPKLQNYGTTDSSKYWHWGSQLSKCGSKFTKKTVCFPGKYSHYL